MATMNDAPIATSREESALAKAQAKDRAEAQNGSAAVHRKRKPSRRMPTAGPVQLESLDDVYRLAETLAASGFFSDARQASQAVTKILAGAELGLPSIASMTGIYVIKSKISMGAGVVASQIKRSGRYDYRVKEHSDEQCVIDFFENGECIGTSTFDREDARKAGTKNMDSYPRNMMFARAMTNGARWYCPDVFNGPVYTPEEMGAPVNGDGEVEEAYWEEVQPQQITTEPQRGRQSEERFQKRLGKLEERMAQADDLEAVATKCADHAWEEWHWGEEEMAELDDAAERLRDDKTFGDALVTFRQELADAVEDAEGMEAKHEALQEGVQAFSEKYEDAPDRHKKQIQQVAANVRKGLDRDVEEQGEEEGEGGDDG